MSLLLFVTLALVGTYRVSATDYSSNEYVQLFRQYVQINTTSGNDLTDAVNFWKDLAADADVSIAEYEFTSGYPVLVLTWPGSDPSLCGIMLNSHMDVVPADEDDGWKYPPFDATIDDLGNIYGRGTQDMKSVGIQYYLALRNLKESGKSLLRTVYMTLQPDEEVGGENGMQKLLKSDEFAAMNVCFEMDEGTSFPLPMVALFKQDKVVWQIQVDCYGEAAHSSTFPARNSTAAGQCLNFMDLMYVFRNEEYNKYLNATVNDSGSYTGINMNKLSTSGSAINVIPQTVTAYFDIRLGTAVNEAEMATKLNDLAAAAGPNVIITYILQDEQSPATIVDSTNPFYVAISNAATELGVVLLPAVPPGSTDARFVRNTGIPAFGLSPMPNTPLLLHSTNEYLNAETFLKGIDIYEAIIYNLSNIAADETSADSSVYLISTAE